jgi:hypothetical protein
MGKKKKKKKKNKNLMPLPSVEQGKTVNALFLVNPPLPPISETKLQTENMEVYHHPHTPGKKWHHYFWEFFMLFLAVTLGFFVENMREHLSDRKKEKSYIQSLVADLKDDSTTISRIAPSQFKIIHGQDSLVDLLNSYKDNDSINRRCYRFFLLYTTSYPEIVFNERTMSQLLNTGNMRLIHRQSTSDSIMDYNFNVKTLQSQERAYEEYFKKTLDFSGNIFDFTIARADMHEDYTFTQKASKGKINLKPLTSDPQTIKKYAIQVSLLESILESFMLKLKYIKEKATNLIALLQKEYHL